MSHLSSTLLSEYQAEANSYVKLVRQLPELIAPKRQTIVQRCFDIKVSFAPQSRFIIVWNIINVVIIYVYFIEIPITIAFENHRTEEENRYVFQLINFPALLIFMVGVFIRLKTAYYKEGILMSNSTEVRRNYIKSFLLVDVVSIVAIGIEEVANLTTDENTNAYRFVVILFYCKLGTLLRTEKAIIESFDLNRRLKAGFKMTLMLAKIFLVCNFCACGFFFLSDNITSLWPTCEDCCWIQKTKMGRDSLKDINQFSVQYIYSLYWASTTMISIGYGDITPQNHLEIAYTIVIEFISCLLYAYAINSIWNIIQQLNAKKEKIHFRMNIINIYMRDKKIDSTLQSKINAYLAHYYHTKNLREKAMEDEIISVLTPELRKELYYQAYGSIFSNQFFRVFDSEVLEEAATKVQEIGYFQQQIVESPLNCSTYPLYHLIAGELLVYICIKFKLNRIENGMSVGLYEFLTQTHYLSTLKTTKYSLVYKLDYTVFKNIISRRAMDFERFHSYKVLALVEGEIKMLKTRCHYCQAGDHRSEVCFNEGIRQLVGSFILRYKQTSQRHYCKRRQRNNRKAIEAKSISLKRKEPNHQSEIVIPQAHLSHLHPSQIPHSHAHQSHLHSPINREEVIARGKARSRAESQSEEGIERLIIESQCIDKVQNYDCYFSNGNADYDAKELRRRNMTIMAALASSY